MLEGPADEDPTTLEDAQVPAKGQAGSSLGSNKAEHR